MIPSTLRSVSVSILFCVTCYCADAELTIDLDEEEKLAVHIELHDELRGVTGSSTNGTSPFQLFIFLPDATNAVAYAEQAVFSAREAGFKRQAITVMDTTQRGLGNRSEFLRHEVGRLYRTVPAGLTFSMLQNAAAAEARQAGQEYYFWMHSDVVIASDHNESFCQSARHVVDHAPPDWGVIFFQYDWFAAYKTEALMRVPWDLGISHYRADCDFYHRIGNAGYKTYEEPDLNKHSGGRYPAVLHKRDVPIPIENLMLLPGGTFHEYFQHKGGKNLSAFEASGLAAADNPGASPYEAQVERYSVERSAGEAYYLKKWGTRSCQLHGKPHFDVPSLA